MTDLVKVAESILMAPWKVQVKTIRCAYCNGTGWSPVVRESNLGQQGERCVNCAGTGYVVEER